MSDLRVSITEQGADLELVAGDLAVSSGLEEAVLVSLYSDARATEDEAGARGLSDPRGWWGEDSGDRFGSKLWQLSQGKLTTATLRVIEDHVRESLGWMRAEGIVDQVDARATINSRNRSMVEIDVVLRRGTARLWSELWDGVATGQSPRSTVGAATIRLLFS